MYDMFQRHVMGIRDNNANHRRAGISLRVRPSSSIESGEKLQKICTESFLRQWNFVSSLTVLMRLDLFCNPWRKGNTVSLHACYHCILGSTVTKIQHSLVMSERFRLCPTSSMQQKGRDANWGKIVSSVLTLGTKTTTCLPQ